MSASGGTAIGSRPCPEAVSKRPSWAPRTVVVTLHHPKRMSYFDDWRDAFSRSNLFDAVVANLFNPLDRRRLPDLLAGADVTVLLHSVLGDSVAEADAMRAAFQGRSGPLVSFVGNELSLPGSPMAGKVDFLEAVGADIVATQLLQEAGEHMYARLNARVVSLPHALNPDAFRSDRPHRDRPVEIGFRGARYGSTVGDNERNALIDHFARTPPLGLVTDIRTGQTLSRDRWRRFLNRCKGTIAAESGSSFVGADDAELADVATGADRQVAGRRIRAALRPVTRFLPEPVCRMGVVVLERLSPRREEPPAQMPGRPPAGAVYGKCISSRHWDAIGTETCQVMLPGRYNDILEPGMHYLELERDFSNVDEVIARLRDDEIRDGIVRCARELALDAHTHAHRMRQLHDLLSA